MKVLLTGAPGFVGTRLSALLAERGHRVTPVSRRPGSAVDWSEESLRRGVADSDAIVHLAGENLVGGRWTAAQKAKLRASRIETGERLARLASERKPSVFVTASAVGYYGPSETNVFTETSPPGSDFLARLCADWEAATRPAADAGVRTAAVRLGVVLGRGGGALAKMLPPFRLGLGGPVGSGRQWFPWIHVDDAAAMFCRLVEDGAQSGAWNGTAPEAVRSRDFAKALGKALHRPAIFPLPAAVLQIALGEASSVLLTGQNVKPERPLAAGFEFRYPTLAAALADAVRP